jgi:acetate---CoA ligase (ADP-forming)
MMIPETHEQDVRRHLERLAGYPLLAGYRGSSVADVEALTALVVALSEYLLSHPDTITELDLNPVMVLPAGQGVVAVDAVLVADR